MEPLERATKILSGSSYPTIADVRYYFNEIREHLEHCVEKDNFDQYILADSVNQKIKEYWMILDNATTIASILDPRNKISVFELGESTTKAINALKDQFSLYLTQKPQSQPSHSQENVTSQLSPREYFHQLKKRRLGTVVETSQTSTSPNSDFSELERYLALPCDENVEPLLW